MGSVLQGCRGLQRPVLRPGGGRGRAGFALLSALCSACHPPERGPAPSGSPSPTGQEHDRSPVAGLFHPSLGPCHSGQLRPLVWEKFLEMLFFSFPFARASRSRPSVSLSFCPCGFASSLAFLPGSPSTSFSSSSPEGFMTTIKLLTHEDCLLSSKHSFCLPSGVCVFVVS